MSNVWFWEAWINHLLYVVVQFGGLVALTIITVNDDLYSSVCVDAV